MSEGGEIIQIHVDVARFLYFDMSLAQGFILHLKFDLMHLQLMQEFIDRTSRQLGRLPARQLSLGGYAQFVQVLHCLFLVHAIP